MKLTVNTTFLDANAALQAYRDYKQGKYSEAIVGLLPILDVEPCNWQARLFLGVCYYKTGQKFAAVHAFHYVWENCGDGELRKKACLALQSVRSEIEAQTADSGSPSWPIGEGQHLYKPPSLDHIFSVD